jgi:hypothetical protein
MFGTTAWIALFLAVVLIMFFAQFRDAGPATLTKTGDAVARRVPGRVILLLFWIFVGVHLFTRYTLPGH